MTVQVAVEEAHELLAQHDILPESQLGRVVTTLVETNVLQDRALRALDERVKRLEEHVLPREANIP